jgi:hypothetical protein
MLYSRWGNVQVRVKSVIWDTPANKISRFNPSTIVIDIQGKITAVWEAN